MKTKKKKTKCKSCGKTSCKKIKIVESIGGVEFGTVTVPLCEVRFQAGLTKDE